MAAYSAEYFEIQRYRKALDIAAQEDSKKGHVNGIGLGIVFAIIFSSYSLAFWYGSRLIYDDEATAGSRSILAIRLS